MSDIRPLDSRLSLCQLGEGIHWDRRSMSLYWVDIERQVIHRYHPETRQPASWTVSKKVSFAFPKEDHLILCMADGVYRFDPVTGTEEPIALLELPENHRLNDGKLDPNGRLWVGTINTAAEPSQTAALYVLRHQRLEEVESGYVNANGKVWSLDGRLMYHADTSRCTIWEYDYDPGTGTPSNKRVFVSLEGENPDGLGIDSNGNIIAAMFGGKCVKMFSHRGDLVGRLDLPVPNPTSCVVVGSMLYVTTAFDGMTDEQRKASPLSGQVLVSHLSG